MIRVSVGTAAVATSLVLAGCGGGAGQTPRDAGDPAPDGAGSGAVITEADSGTHVRLSPGEAVVLRLGGGYTWDDPESDGDSVELAPVDYFQDPGFREWAVQAIRPGTTVITAVCTPAAECPEQLRTFELTVTVRG